MTWHDVGRGIAPGLLAAALGTAALAGERSEGFDRDPDWEGRNNRSADFPARGVRQAFGFSRTRHAGGKAAGEAGGLVTPDAAAAYYAKRIPTRTFADRLTASGVLSTGEGKVHALVGFFDAGTLNEWRTPNTIALRIQARGDVFYAYVEYATRRWRAGGDSPKPFARVRDPQTGRDVPRGFRARGASHTWSLTYDPQANEGRGSITATIDGETSICDLAPGHKADGATFDRFGVLNVLKSVDDPGEIWLDDLDLNGTLEGFAADPGWDGYQNRRTYTSASVRPRFDFGFSPTHHAGGKAAGELGGLVFRGDCREPARLACYGDRVGPLRLDGPLKAAGKVVLRRGVSDSTTLFGFYDAGRSLRVSPAQDSGFPEHFLGFAIEGPSSEGFFVYPAFRATGGRHGHAAGADPPRILPDGKPHDWTLEYTPSDRGGRGRIVLTLDGRAVHLDLRDGDRIDGPAFDRFGLVTTWIDGNGQSVYFDDLVYTAGQ